MIKKPGILLLFPLLISFSLKAQDIKDILVNLYTDSLKKGTYNYINIDGKLASGRFIPLDTNYLVFSTSEGKFFGNSLYIEKNSRAKKVKIQVVLKKNSALHKEFEVWIKTTDDNTPLPTNQEILERIRNEQRKGREKRA
ncbi:MAG: hypothetical protein IT254_02560 [Chitinophagaceae bacterium]|nr:hypothetical protein [Bacteroidota bacterium]MCC6257182.1 hypothetical protein [Chitinophagaceae bacterium]MCW5916675.1 hypothetical protein [Ferruginibacter sp.]